MLRRVYDWTLSLGSSRHAVWALAAVSFIESSVFPIPPDALLIPMIIADRSRAWKLAAICTVASVLGGFLGYAIGYFAFDAIGEPLLRFYGISEQYLRLEELYAKYGAWLIIIKGATPIPFKLLTITAGFIHMNFWTFLWASLASRAFSFMLVGILFRLFGAPIKAFIDKYLIWVTGAFLVAVVAGFLAIGALSGDGKTKEADKCSGATLATIGLDRK